MANMNAKRHGHAPFTGCSPTLGGVLLNVWSRQTHKLCATLWIITMSVHEVDP